MMHPGHSRFCSLALSWMFVSFLSPHLSVTWIWKTSLFLECITHCLLFLHLQNALAPFPNLFSLLWSRITFLSVSRMWWPLLSWKLYHYPVWSSIFGPLTSLFIFPFSQHYIFLSLKFVFSSRTCSGYSFHKFVTWAFSIIRDDGLSLLWDHILHLPSNYGLVAFSFGFNVLISRLHTFLLCSPSFPPPLARWCSSSCLQVSNLLAILRTSCL